MSAGVLPIGRVNGVMNDFYFIRVNAVMRNNFVFRVIAYGDYFIGRPQTGPFYIIDPLIDVQAAGSVKFRGVNVRDERFF